jgi:hypothetical protein
VNYLVKVRLGWENHNGNPPDGGPSYFTATIPKQYIKILPNDWPYRGRSPLPIQRKTCMLTGPIVPTHIKHYVIWSQLPVIHDDLIHESIRGRVAHDGLCGFTGQEHPTAEKTDPDGELLKQGGLHVHTFVLDTWPESYWECAWFVNPPVSASLTEFQTSLTQFTEVAKCQKSGSHSRVHNAKVLIILLYGSTGSVRPPASQCPSTQS